MLLAILPCVIGLFVLAQPVITLLYEHGAFTAYDAMQTSRAVQFYLLGTAFAAVDQPLVFAFYARRNTLLPNLVAVVGLGIYLVVAFSSSNRLAFWGWCSQTRRNWRDMHGHVVFHTKTPGRHSRRGIGADCPEIVGLGHRHGRHHVFHPPMILFAGGFVQEVFAVVLPAVIGGLVYVLMLKLLRVGT